MNRTLIVAALIAVACAASGCGRKGPLELPPPPPKSAAPSGVVAG